MVDASCCVWGQFRNFAFETALRPLHWTSMKPKPPIPLYLQKYGGTKIRLRPAFLALSCVHVGTIFALIARGKVNLWFEF